MSSERNEIEVAFAAARQEPSALRARLALHQIAKRCTEVVKEDPKLAEIALVGSGALAELAKLEHSQVERLRLRRRAVEILRDPIKQAPSANLIASRANRVVDLFYDTEAREDSPRIQSLLASTVSNLTNALATGGFNREEASLLLIQKSSVLRCQAMLSRGRESMARAGEAVRCARRATEEAPKNGFAWLELGQALGSSARFADNDEDCFRNLQLAEEALLASCEGGEPLSLLVLSRFYRQSYRPALAIEVFREYDEREIYRRVLLSEAFLVGEAARSLWYSEYESSFVDEALDYARSILLSAIDAGYDTARHFTALAFVQAAAGDTGAAEFTLRRLSPESVPSWLELIDSMEVLLDKREIEALGQAFAVGINDANVWRSLGTFASSFLHNDSLAMRLYSIARRLDPSDAITLTNIARVHLRQGTPEDLLQADEVLRRAESCAARTFVWWRSLRDELKQRQGRPNSWKTANTDIQRAKGRKIGFRDLQKRYGALVSAVEEGSVTPQKRGLLVQEIIADLLALTFQSGDPVGSHYVDGRQVDAAFTYRDVRHRVEVKWEKRALDRSHLDSLPQVTKQAETRGIVVSMSGFTESAIGFASEIGHARALILVDRREIEDVLAGRIRFEGLLERKLIQWRRTGVSYPLLPAKRHAKGGSHSRPEVGVETAPNSGPQADGSAAA